jgi:hypothetical protein
MAAARVMMQAVRLDIQVRLAAPKLAAIEDQAKVIAIRDS